MQPPVLTKFSFIWPSDLYFIIWYDLYSNMELDMRQNILTKLQADKDKNAASNFVNKIGLQFGLVT